METAIIIAAFAGGFISMFAVHMLIVDIYEQRHRQQVRKLEGKIRRLQKGDGKDIKVEIMHTFATPDDVSDLQFLED